MLDEKRLLITGSRFWVDAETIQEAITAAEEALGNFIVISGACPEGLDELFSVAALQRGHDIEEHPADWSRPCTEKCYHRPRVKNGKPYCPVAGNIRNSEMIESGADLCYAFPVADSRGTVDCMIKSTKAGVPTFVWSESVAKQLSPESTRGRLVYCDEALF